MTLTFAEKKLLATLVENYAADPNRTLFECFEHFGRKEFEDTLRVILPHYLADVSMQIAIRRCILRQRESWQREARDMAEAHSYAGDFA